MRFSYYIEDQCLLQSICLPVEKQTVCLVTGVESVGFSLIGGIVAKLLPIRQKLDWPQLQALINDYSGTLSLEEGELPGKAVYVGPDPDRHLLFAKVSEELETRLSDGSDPTQVLELFSLNPSFYTRPIYSLSGGEKMKLCLSLAFSKPYDCYVLHGVIPWLDQEGRKLLARKVQELKQRACIVFLEHETYPLSNVVDFVYEFNGLTTFKKEKSILLDSKSNKRFHASKVPCPTSQRILEFRQVTFDNYPDSGLQRTTPLLDRLSFYFYDRSVYALIGANGAGKSTIAKLIFRILTPDSGKILLCGRPIITYNRMELCELICYVSQFPEQQITYGNIKQYKLNAQKNDNDLSLSLMEKWLSLDDAPITTLSFFEMKLLLLTSFITEKTKLLIMDEPSWGMSQSDVTELFSLVEEVCKQLKCTLVIITHNDILAHSINAAIFHLKTGKLSPISDRSQE